MFQIEHHGAVDGVTGSCHELTLGGGGNSASVLIDCGLFQGAETSGRKASAVSQAIDFPIDRIQALIVTHCHIRIWSSMTRHAAELGLTAGSIGILDSKQSARKNFDNAQKMAVRTVPDSDGTCRNGGGSCAAYLRRGDYGNAHRAEGRAETIDKVFH